MIKEIENWLCKPVYFDGVELYEKYGSSAMLKRVFAGSSDSFNKKKLTNELTEILEAAKAKEAAKPAIVEPQEVKDLHTQAQNLMAQRSALKERARVIISLGITQSDELKTIAYQLAYDLKSELDGIYGRIQYWKVNGQLPHSEAAAIQGIAELIKRRNTVRTYLSRDGKPEKLEKWKSELFELDLKIKEME